MKIENPLAYSFFMEEELYLLNNDRKLLAQALPIELVDEEIFKLTLPILETKAVSFNYLGANKKAFLIVVNYTDAEFIADAHLTALTSVLARLQHTIDDIAILNLANYPDIEFDTLLGYFKPQKILFLGAKALPAGMEAMSIDKLQKIDGIAALFSFSFDEMMENNERKKIFWEQMKQL